jgi:hypothetical protein
MGWAGGWGKCKAGGSGGRGRGRASRGGTGGLAHVVHELARGAAAPVCAFGGVYVFGGMGGGGCQAFRSTWGEAWVIVCLSQRGAQGRFVGCKGADAGPTPRTHVLADLLDAVSPAPLHASPSMQAEHTGTHACTQTRMHAAEHAHSRAGRLVCGVGQEGGKLGLVHLRACVRACVHCVCDVLCACMRCCRPRFGTRVHVVAGGLAVSPPLHPPFSIRWRAHGVARSGPRRAPFLPRTSLPLPSTCHRPHRRCPAAGTTHQRRTSVHGQLRHGATTSLYPGTPCSPLPS